MRFRIEVSASAPPDAVLPRLHAPERWPEWVDGLGDIAVSGREVRLRFDVPRAFGLVLDLDPTSNGLSYAMVQGDVADAAGRIEIEPSNGGSRIRWQGELLFPVSVPTPLLRELEGVIFPRWLTALGAGHPGQSPLDQASTTLETG